MEPFRLTATQAIAHFNDGSLTVEAYALSLLSRIDERDTAVRAWAHLDRAYVLEQARALDCIPREARGPLHGVAVGVKDVINTKDMPTQHNSPLYAGSCPGVDAASVLMLRSAGALILGKTTTTEFAVTTNGGVTANPHNPLRTPGGSSSGSGAAVADCQAALALGTQTGGSVVRPASFCGAYALKPTWGAVSRDGQKIYAITYDTLGWLARSVDDLELMARVFGMADDSEADDNRGCSYPLASLPLSPPLPVSVKPLEGIAFAICKTPQWTSAGPGTVCALKEGAGLLAAAGGRVEELVLPPEFGRMTAWYATVLHHEGRTSFLPEKKRVGSNSIGNDNEMLSDFVTGLADGRTKTTHAAYLEALDGMAALRPRIDGIIARGGYAAIVTPSTPDEAPPGLASTGSAVFNSMWTALHTPVVNVPGFHGESGMPIGLSLVGARYRDMHLLAVAKTVAGIFGANKQ